MAADLVLPAPAKLNLFLHITGRQDNGYHSLQTLFQLLDYGDELTFSANDTGDIRLTSGLPGVSEEDNLIVRAARLLQDKTGCRRGADIGLKKVLPMGGGLGGGSSDAATTLLALDCLWNLNLSLTELSELGLKLGADVPVFVGGQTAWAEGVGERLEAVEMPEKWYLVIAPPVQVETREIFAHPDLTRNTHPIKIRAFLEQGGRNDCQPVAEKLYPEVRKASQWLGQYAPASMTGTGACVFASFENQRAAEDIFRQMPDAWRGFVAKGTNLSVTHQTMREQGCAYPV